MNYLTKKFLAVGNAEKINEIRKRENIKYIPWVDDMKKIYSQTRITLVPSTWFEPFGRVVIESMSNGIPCIVSNRGGLPETVGNVGLVTDVNDTDSWVNSIRKLDDDSYYKKISDRAMIQAKKFDLKIQYKKIENILNKV